MLDTLTDWGVRLGPSRLILEAPDEAAATDILINRCDGIADGLTRWNLWECLIFYPGCRRPYRIPANLTPDNYFENYKRRALNMVNGVTVIGDRLFLNKNLIDCIDSTLVKVMDRLIELAKDGIPGGLVTSPAPDKPNYQIWVNGPTEQLFRGAGRELVRVDTTKFWYPPDRDRFYKTIQDLNAGTKFDFTYKAQGSPSDPDFWLELTNEAEIVEAMGQRFRLFTSKEAKPIPRPANV